MLKYTETEVVFKEVPDEITLAINISGCSIHCPGCHSKHLWNNIGDDLTEDALKTLIDRNRGITCVSFMGGDNEPAYINHLAEYIKKNYPGLKISWYSGRDKITDEINLSLLDFIKIGPYIEEFGGLDKPGTNQIFYKVQENETLQDITSKFKSRFI